MKKEINPKLAGVFLALALLGIGFLIYIKTGGFGPQSMTPQENPMPKEAADAMKDMFSNANKKTEEARKQGLLPPKEEKKTP